MNSSMVELSPALQTLIDERLDSIERILLVAGVSRGERRGILSEVEAHVFELLARRTTAEPTREDVLAVLAQLDPPESYAPEGFDRRKVNEAFAKPKPREPELSLLAAGSAAVGVFLLFVVFMTVMAGGDGGLVACEVIAMLAVSVTGAICLFRIRRSNGWLYGARPALFATLLFPMVAVNVVVVILLSAMWDVAAFLGLAIVFLAFNGAIIYGAWHSCKKLVKSRTRLPPGLRTPIDPIR
jgi:hypothetical protein